MGAGYQDTKQALNYADFLDTKNGQIQQNLLFGAIFKTLHFSDKTVILDAACGTGWLADKLKAQYPSTYGCDSSGPLIDLAKHRHPAVEFSHCDIQTALPYPDGFFDIIILNMAAPDLFNLNEAVKNLAAKLKMGGKLVMTIPNPYLTYPVAAWKRSVADFILMRKPKLKIIREYFNPSAFAEASADDSLFIKNQGESKINREFNGFKIESNFYTLNNYISSAKMANLSLAGLTELKSTTDSKNFDLNYQMFRYPLILLLEFTK